MQIRLMRPDDYEQAMSLWNGSHGVGISPDDSRENIENYLLRNPGCSFAAIENRKT